MRWFLILWLLIAGWWQIERLQTCLRVAAAATICKTVDCQYQTMRPDNSLECRYHCAVIEIGRFLRNTGSDTLFLDDFREIHNQAPGYQQMAEQWAALKAGGLGK